MNEYYKFLETKRHTSENHGIDVNYLPDGLFDYQRFICGYAIKKGRCAVYLDTGLGKTLIQLTIAKNYFNHTKKPILIITPLAVAFQFIEECERFKIGSIEYSKDGRYSSDIVVCNYERLEKFNPKDFDCVLLDESSILKNFNGAIKDRVNTFLKKVKYRYLFTATPAPNDYIELGTSSEALGYLGYMDMLGKYFANNENNIRPQDIGSKWYLKPHAKTDFFRWVSTWSIFMKMPSDYGFDDSTHILPNLDIKFHSVKNQNNWIVNGQMMMFNQLAQRLGEVREEQKMTIKERCEKAHELVGGHDFSVYWCNFNDEGDLLDTMDKEAYQIKGSQSIDEKEDILLNFANKQIKRIITKPKITAFGLNWQHCNHTVYFPTFSYEQFYQAIRRFYRYGQTRDVICDMVYSDGQKRVIDALLVKTEKAKELFSNLNREIHNSERMLTKQFEKEIIKPKFV